MVPLENYLVLSAIIFSLGVYGVLARRNAVLVLMGTLVEITFLIETFVNFSIILAISCLNLLIPLGLM